MGPPLSSTTSQRCQQAGGGLRHLHLQGLLSTLYRSREQQTQITLLPPCQDPPHKAWRSSGAGVSQQLGSSGTQGLSPCAGSAQPCWRSFHGEGCRGRLTGKPPDPRLAPYLLAIPRLFLVVLIRLARRLLHPRHGQQQHWLGAEKGPGAVAHTQPPTSGILPPHCTLRVLWRSWR